MAFIDPDQLDLLKQARERAEKLVAEIRRQRDDLLANPPTHLDAESMSQGRIAMDNAVASAERMLAAVEGALAEAMDPDARDNNPDLN
jgi:hypothetical protein